MDRISYAPKTGGRLKQSRTLYRQDQLTIKSIGTMVPVFFIYQKNERRLSIMPQKGKTSTRERTGVGKEGISREERRPEKLYMGMSTPIPMRK